MFCLRIEFEDITPSICRRLWIDRGVTLIKLHHAIQAAMGWTDSHLHSFHIGGAPPCRRRALQDRRWGRPSYGVVDGESVFDLGSRLRYCDLKALVAAEAYDEVRRALRTAPPDTTTAGLELLPVIPNPGKILCVGVNYEEHRIEAGRERTEKPTLFARFAESQIGHRRPMLVPRESDQLDFEGEIAVVIGRAGRRIRAADAMAHVAGYACYNDGTIRDWQRHTTQWTPGKNFAHTGSFGPWMVTRDEIPDGAVLELTTRLNGKVMQRADTRMMIFSIAAIIEYASAFVPLAPGDVIATGTPGGIGFKRNPPVYMKPGDAVEVEVSGIGTLVNAVLEER
ncbi:MAG: fumarylacetoacetate hydrolase family protein [Betaproteobacteria bacterium]